MGNWVGKVDRGMVHPIDINEGEDRAPSLDNLMRVKVRMTKRQLKELMAQVEKNKLGHQKSEIGIVILKECLQGRFTACVVPAAAEIDRKVSKYERNWMLNTISEEEEEELHLL